MRKNPSPLTSFSHLFELHNAIAYILDWWKWRRKTAIWDKRMTNAKFILYLFSLGNLILWVFFPKNSTALLNNVNLYLVDNTIAHCLHVSNLCVIIINIIITFLRLFFFSNIFCNTTIHLFGIVALKALEKLFSKKFDFKFAL